MSPVDTQEDDLPQASSFDSGDFIRIVKSLATSPDSEVMARSVLKTYLDTLYSQGVLKTYFDTIYLSDLCNYIINGGFSFAQRQLTPDTLTTYATNTYSADRWKTYVENASYQYARVDGLGETGLTSQYFGEFKKITNNGKMFIYQIVEGRESVGLRGKTVIFQCQMKASASKTIRMGIFQLTSSGAIDSVPSPIVTAAGANSTDPTMGTNVSIITAAQSKSVTTSMQTFSVSVTVPATSKNLICAVWTDSQFTANDILYIAEVGLYVTSIVQGWKPRPTGDEIELCQRYFIAFGGDGISWAVFGMGMWYSTTLGYVEIHFPREMRIKPVLSYTALTNLKLWTTTGTNVPTAMNNNQGTKKAANLEITVASGGVAGQATMLSINNATPETLYFDAEL